MKEIECTLKYECPKLWRELKVTSDSSVRFCDHCDQNVFWANTQEEADRFSSQGRCIAYETVEYATLGMPEGSQKEYFVVLLVQEISGKKLTEFKKVLHPNLSYSEIRNIYNNKEVAIEVGFSKEDAEKLKDKLELIDVKCEIREE